LKFKYENFTEHSGGFQSHSSFVLGSNPFQSFWVFESRFYKN